MLETNEIGQAKLDEIANTIDSFDWSDWDIAFIQSVSKTLYQNLTRKQQAVVTRLWDELKEWS